MSTAERITKIGPMIHGATTVLIPVPVDVAILPVAPDCCNGTGKLHGTYCPYCTTGIELHLDAIAADLGNDAAMLAQMDARAQHGTALYRAVEQRYLGNRMAYDTLERKFWLMRADDLEHEPELHYFEDDSDPRFEDEIPF